MRIPEAHGACTVQVSTERRPDYAYGRSHATFAAAEHHNRPLDIMAA